MTARVILAGRYWASGSIGSSDTRAAQQNAEHVDHDRRDVAIEEPSSNETARPHERDHRRLHQKVELAAEGPLPGHRGRKGCRIPRIVAVWNYATARSSRRNARMFDRRRLDRYVEAALQIRHTPEPLRRQ